MGFDHTHVAGMLANFGDFMDKCDADPQREATYLEAYLEWWMEIGDAIQLAGGNYGTYMLAVTLIIHDFAKHDRYSRPHMEGVFDPEELEKGVPDCLSREYWEQTVYQRSHGLPVYQP